MLLLLLACSDKVHSDEDAAHVYAGLDLAVEKAMNLGMQGYAAASDANIPDQQADGDVSGTITVSGQVDQGASDNKELRLGVALDEYADLDEDDDVAVTYQTDDAALPELDLSLRDIPDGTFEGTFVGGVTMDGDLEGTVNLDLAVSGAIAADPDVPDGLVRVDGSTTISGTATSDYGTYDVDVTR